MSTLRNMMGLRVTIDAPGGWFHGMTGTVVRGGDIPGMWTVETDTVGEPRALCRDDELRIIAPEERSQSP